MQPNGNDFDSDKDEDAKKYTGLLLAPSAVFPNPFEDDILRRANSTASAGVIISGQPGIGKSDIEICLAICTLNALAGKSVQLLFILILRLHAHLPTIWQESDTMATVFTEEGVFQLSFGDVSMDTIGVFGKYFPPCTWLLFDPNANAESRPVLSHTRVLTVQASSPIKDRFSWTSKDRVYLWFMRPFTLQELIIA